MSDTGSCGPLVIVLFYFLLQWDYSTITFHSEFGLFTYVYIYTMSHEPIP